MVEAVGEVPVKLVENSFVVRMEMVVDFWEKEVNLADLVAVLVALEAVVQKVVKEKEVEERMEKAVKSEDLVEKTVQEEEKFRVVNQEQEEEIKVVPVEMD